MNTSLALITMFDGSLNHHVVRFDIFGCLPPEVASHVLRMLDVKSLMVVMATSHRWSDLVLGDPILRERINKRLEKVRRRKKENQKPSKLLDTVRKLFKKFLEKMSGSSRKRKMNEPIDAASSRRKILRV